MPSHTPRRRSRRLLVVAASPAIALFCPVVSAAQTAPQQCVAVVLPSVRGADSTTDATASAIRESLLGFLTGPNLRSIPLDARLRAQAGEEARQKSCERVLTVTATRKRGAGGVLGRAIGTAATAAAWSVPYGRTAATIGARSAALGGAHALAEVAQTTKAKDEVTLDYQLESAERAQLVSAKVSQKATADGEDLLTPLVEQVADAITAATSAPGR